MRTYRPLPDCVTVRPSQIDGLGLFATSFIPKGTSLGISHVVVIGVEDDLVRTPLGGFFNHSDTPNCSTVSGLDPVLGACLTLVASLDIPAGSEITVTYTLYDPVGAPTAKGRGNRSPGTLRTLAANLLVSSKRTVEEVLSELPSEDAETVRALMDLFRPV